MAIAARVYRPFDAPSRRTRSSRAPGVRLGREAPGRALQQPERRQHRRRTAIALLRRDPLGGGGAVADDARRRLPAVLPGQLCRRVAAHRPVRPAVVAERRADGAVDLRAGRRDRRGGRRHPEGLACRSRRDREADGGRRVPRSLGRTTTSGGRTASRRTTGCSSSWPTRCARTRGTAKRPPTTCTTCWAGTRSRCRG